MSVANVSLRSNVMLVQDSRMQEIRFLPGDFAFLVYKERWPRPESMQMDLTEQQFIEHTQYLVCQICRQTCAGTCRGSTAH
jgi:hypothetical protein